MSSGKVAVVTGANAGIGLALCEQLLDTHPNLTLCLSCRNKHRAEQAREKLLMSHSAAVIDIVIIDTSSVHSVLEAAKVFKKKYNHIDFLYLNAGVMQAGGVHWNRILPGIFSSRCVHVLTTGEGLVIQKNNRTDEGIMNVFATNVFGHYVLLRELEPCLGAGGGSDAPSQLIWTSSSNAQRQNFSMDDLQHSKGEEPYSSSKYATDMLSVALNERYSKQGMYSHTICPGLVMTSLTDGILPAWFWTLMLPFLLLMRILVSSLTVSPAKGATALAWVSHQRPENLDPRTKFLSKCYVTGETHVGMEKLKVDEDESTALLNQLEEMRNKLKQDISKTL